MNLNQGKKAVRQIVLRQEGSIGDLLSVGLCILAMVAVMTAFMDCVALINKKTMVGQAARNYVLRMETCGYLTAEDEQALRKELLEQGVTEISLDGTTREEVDYGAEITLRITGKIEGRDFEEKRVSTAKH